MNTELEKLIENVVKDLRSEHPSVMQKQNTLDMIDAISLLSNSAMKATEYFISLMQLPEVFIIPKQGA